MAEKKQAGRPLGPTGEAVRLNIRRIRDKQNVSGVELSARLEKLNRPIPPLGIQRIESGARRVDVDDLSAIAVALGVSPASLLMPDVKSAQDQVTVTGSEEPIAAARAWAWIGGALPMSGDHPMIDQMMHGWPAWYAAEFIAGMTQELHEKQLIAADEDSYGNVTFNHKNVPDGDD